MRNEVQLMPHLHPWEVDLIRNDKQKRFFVRKYRLPITHSIQFNPKSESLTREIRKALDYSIDRQTILDTYVLRSRPGAQDPSAKYGRVVTAPYWTECYANSPVVEKRKYDLRVGMAMVIAAKLRLSQRAKAEFIKAEEAAGRDPAPEAIDKVMADAGVLPTLRMLCAPDPTARVAAEAIVSQMKRIGLTIDLLPIGSQTDDWDLLYRTSRMVEPLVDLWPFLAIDREARVDSLAHLPDWLAQELVNLDNAGSFAAATEQLHLLHRHLAAEGHFIPLWEVDEYMAVRKSVIGVPTEPLGVYQDIEHWTIKW
jgi:ABC-type transport system substrate-binding protein